MKIKDLLNPKLIGKEMAESMKVYFNVKANKKKKKKTTKASKSKK